MRRIILAFLGLAFLAGSPAAQAIDINPSKDTAPRSTWDTGGNSFSIFNGDPKRIQRANEVDPKSFDVKVTVLPNPVLLKGGPAPSLKITLSVHNHAKKTYTLSFPTAQRWDFRISNAAGTIIYTYSDNCEFVQTVGSSMVNYDDKLVYNESVDPGDLSAPLTPGLYKVEAIVSNYPEMKATMQFTVQ